MSSMYSIAYKYENVENFIFFASHIDINKITNRKTHNPRIRFYWLSARDLSGLSETLFDLINMFRYIFNVADLEIWDVRFSY